MRSRAGRIGMGVALLLAASTLPACVEASVRPGLEVLLEDSLTIVAGRRLGLVTNQTGIDRQGRSSIERLVAEPRANLVRLFAPEHGVDGSRPAGEVIHNEIHTGTGLLVTSLYSGERRIDPVLFADLDQVLFDIQDIGVRPYTFVSTLAEVMKTGREADIEVVVLDRPNPLGGVSVSGLILDADWASFIGPYPVPYVHGMTVAELARLFNDEFGIGCRLRTVPMSGWQRSMDFAATGLPWVPTSPNVPCWHTGYALAATGALGELGTISVGVGTASPFWVVGRPGLDGEELVTRLRDRQLPGLAWLPWRWQPSHGAFAGQDCAGVRLLLIDPVDFDAGRTHLALSIELRELLGGAMFDAHPDRILMFDRAQGGDRLRMALQTGTSVELLESLIARETAAFRRLRQGALLYPEES
jgi:uncharacterized protein YbbC (DUF1343 family)